eukprot:NODE_1836_length_2362_cov_7.339597.p1 GENE.NODE_1836_length_2362_cov_7.339597~~NODE_1836_length_2362_cov_7.339597.p1  ORF type:complete len:602 (+),score=173.68 NODE_1836_length_2362_cov_7.339597:446-2251(+)
MSERPEEVAVVAVEVWSGIANLELTVPHCDQNYTRQASLMLTPALLNALQRAAGGEEVGGLQDAASACLAVVVQLAPETCLDAVITFLSGRLDAQEPGPRAAAMLAYGAIMEGPAERVRPLVAPAFAAILQSLDHPVLRRAAAWAAGRSLEFHAACVPDDAKAALFPPCLALMKDPEWSRDLGYVLQGLVAGTRASAAQFPAMSRRLLDDAAAASSEGREALLGSCCVLVRGADEGCGQHLRELLLELLRLAESCQGRQVDGLGSCLQAVTERIGEQVVVEHAEPMMRVYMAVLQAGVEAGAGLHEETLQAVGTLVGLLGARFAGFVAAFWPVLRSAMASLDYPQASATGCGILASIAGALGEGVLPYAEEAQDVALQLLQDPYAPKELRPPAVRCLGALGRALGGRTPHLPQLLAALGEWARESKGKGAGKAKDKDKDKSKDKDKDKDKDKAKHGGKGKGKHKGKEKDEGKKGAMGTLHHLPDEAMRHLDLADAVLEAYAGVFVGLCRTSSVVAAQDHAHDIVCFAAARAALPWAKEPVLSAAATVMGAAAVAFPHVVGEVLAWVPVADKLADVAVQSPDPHVRDLSAALCQFRQLPVMG